MSSLPSYGRLRRRRERKRFNLYSQHFSDHSSHSCSPESKAANFWQRSPTRSLRISIVGLALLGMLIWGVSELIHQPPLVEAQEAQALALQSPWKAASFPVEDFVAYTSPFGYRDHPFGGRSFHYGLDIAAPMGSYIRAWWEGEVVEVTDDTACGTSVVVESDGWLHIYCHLQGHVVVEADGDRWMVDHSGGIQIRQGDTVRSGQRIGRIGMTGRTTGPHLHWGMKYRGKWIDPALVLKAMKE
ncbi:M23 family metallopeptidase [Oscillatoria sp. CS-180]|uniref:M23 family metallopeptidase n=1 Tax=Oscillatoria sp. CS-180 TaxID=3021720 RepID=UPI00232CA5E5|nr:M23 family metallopeptidase [Oscillatoria sp. CS-180]MDB9526717.1 M23 family metallopeptidase [Oscillatoria sp. CS-180]